ncbi:MAG: type II toxin-antitoxin system HigB family toxin [Candidatus Rokuibacteriota bacterium]
MGLLILERFVAVHRDASGAVDAWVRETKAAGWRTPADIKARYPAASFLANSRVVFNIKGNKYRLDTRVAYQTSVVVVKRIGTHAEYSRWTFNDD